MTYFFSASTRHTGGELVRTGEINRTRMIEYLDEGYGFRSAIADKFVSDMWGLRYNPKIVELKPEDEVIYLTLEGHCPVYNVEVEK